MDIGVHARKRREIPQHAHAVGIEFGPNVDRLAANEEWRILARKYLCEFAGGMGLPMATIRHTFRGGLPVHAGQRNGPLRFACVAAPV